MKKKSIAMCVVVLLLVLSVSGCTDWRETETTADSGAKKTSAKVQTDASGLTTEQKNVKKRIEADNKPGAIKHLYILSAYSGQAIIYSTVDGKVTSSGKRLNPYSVTGPGANRFDSFAILIDGQAHKTAEVLQDDGTYGHSIPYLFWWDTKGIFHKHYVSGGQIVHISDQPLAVKTIIINMELEN